LTEVLVVISIIVVLAVALVGVTRKMITNARLSGDANYLRQIASVITMHSSDHDDSYILVSGEVDDAAAKWRWYGIPFQPGQESLLKSPLMDYLGVTEVTELNKITIASVNHTDYVMATSRTYGMPYAPNYNLMANSPGAKPVRRSLVGNPSRTILMLDCDMKAGGPGFNETAAGLSRIGSPDNGMTRVLWADGHVTRMKKQEIIDNALQLLKP
jgi:prepilin-type processing-associated H-X9-DG protein